MLNYFFIVDKQLDRHSLYGVSLSWITEGQLPAIRHHTSPPSTISAANDPVLYGVTVPAAGHSGPTRGPMDGRDAAADTCRAAYGDKKEFKI